MSNEERTYATLVYVGMKVASDGKKYYCYVHVDSVPNDGRELIFETSDLLLYGKPLTPGLAGTVFTIQVSPSDESVFSSVFRNSDKYVGTWQNMEQVRKWQLETRAVNAEYQRNLENKKEYSRDLVEEQLEPLKKVMSGMSAARRQVMIAFILDYLLR
ncbi:MAG TPA: hypothetical protein VI338_06550 [Nitrososphaera sp.]|nr:hypothetical protein [Nitrososphaera sp.]